MNKEEIVALGLTMGAIILVSLSVLVVLTWFGKAFG